MVKRAICWCITHHYVLDLRETKHHLNADKFRLVVSYLFLETRLYAEEFEISWFFV